MSVVFPLIDGFLGYGDAGASIQLQTDVPVDADHPVVKERPELFTAPEPEEPAKRGPGRPPGSKNKPKPAPEEPADG